MAESENIPADDKAKLLRPLSMDRQNEADGAADGRGHRCSRQGESARRRAYFETHKIIVALPVFYRILGNQGVIRTTKTT